MRTYASRIDVLAFTRESQAMNVYYGVTSNNTICYWVESETKKFCGPWNSIKDTCFVLTGVSIALGAWSARPSIRIQDVVGDEERKEILMRLYMK